MPPTPWLWAYWPVMKVARAGQQSGNESTASANVVPCVGEQAPDVRHVRDVGRGHVVGHDDEDVRAAVAAPRTRGAPGGAAVRSTRQRRERGGDGTRDCGVVTCRLSVGRTGRAGRPYIACHTVSTRVVDRSRTRCAPARAGARRPVRPGRRAASGSSPRPPSWSARRPTRSSASTRSCARAGLGRTIFYRHFDDLARPACSGPAARPSTSSTRPSAASARRAPARSRPRSGARIEAVVDVYERHGPLLRAIAEAAAGDEQIARGLRGAARALRRTRRAGAARVWPTSADPAGRPGRDRARAEPHERELPARRVRPRAARVARDRGPDPDRDLGRGHPPLTKGRRPWTSSARPTSASRTCPGYPYEPHYVEVDGLRLHHLDEGDGSTVALLPRRAELELPLPAHARPARRRAGTASCARTSSASAARTSPPTRAGTPTTATSRRSAATSTRSTSTDVTVVVQDWGGPIGLRWAVEHADRVARLVVLNTGLFTGPGEQGVHGLARLRRAHARPADRRDHPGRARRPTCRPRSSPPTTRPSPRRRARRARSASRCSCR